MKIESKFLGFAILTIVCSHVHASDRRPRSSQSLNQFLLSTFQYTPVDMAALSRITPGGMALDPTRMGHQAYKSGGFTTKDGFQVLSVEALTGSESSKAIYVRVLLMLKPCVSQTKVSRGIPGIWISDKHHPNLFSYRTKTFTMSVTMQQGSPGCVSAFSRSSVPLVLPPPYKPFLGGGNLLKSDHH